MGSGGRSEFSPACHGVPGLGVLASDSPGLVGGAGWEGHGVVGQAKEGGVGVGSNPFDCTP